MHWRAMALAVLLVFASTAPALADLVEITGWQANVRERPSRRARVIVTLPRGERLELLEQVGRWFGVRLMPSGEAGFIHASLVRVIRGAMPERPEPGAGASAGGPARDAEPRAKPEATTPPRPVAEPPPAPVPTPQPVWTPPPPPARPPEADLRRLGLEIEGGLHLLTAASQSAEAVFGGESSGLQIGGSLRYALTRSVFIRAGARLFRKEGERVFVAAAGAPVFRLGHPLKLRLVPVYAVIGYRFFPSASLVPYLAAGGGVTAYREESTIGGVSESTTSNKATGLALGGVELVTGRFALGLEASWSTVPDSLGVSGVSAIYDENDVGGVSLSARLAVSF